MTNMNDCEQACEDAAKAFMELEQAIDRATKKAVNVLQENFKVQKAFGDCDEGDLPMHSNHFSEMNSLIGSVVANLTGARDDVSTAHRCGDQICKDGGIIVQGGGGGK